MQLIGLMLAQATTQPAQPPPGIGSMLFPLLVVGFVFYLLVFRPQKRERAQQKQLLDGLKKNDRVITIGGLYGTVVQVKDQEVTLKVDESTNTKMTFMRSAIRSIVSAGPGEEKKDAAG